MRLFRKKKGDLIPPLTYFHITFNISNIEKWKNNRVVTDPVDRWDSLGDEKDFLITLLPQNEYLFHHQEPNQFSPSIGGYATLGSGQDIQLEWNRTDACFFVNFDDPLSGETYTIFVAPMHEILDLLVNRRVTSYNRGSEIIDLDGGYENIYCKQVHMDFSRDWIRYRNSLVTFSAVCVPPSNLVGY